MPPDKTSSARKTLQPACDACHTRRVKCSHDLPCEHCVRLKIICTYEKASRTKKTAGKRIEALRAADQKKAIASPPEEEKRAERSWSQGHPATATPILGSSQWPRESSGVNTVAPGQFPSLHHGDGPRPSPWDGRSVSQTHGPSGAQHSRQPSQTGFAGIPRLASVALDGASPASPRSRMVYDNARQVRFQSVGTSSQRGQYEGHSAAQGSSSFDAGYQGPPVEYGGAPVPSQGMSQYQFGQGAPPYNRGSETMSGGDGRPGAPQDGVNGFAGGFQSIPSSVSFALNAAEMPTMDFLQSSTLPPFSTSMADSLFDDQGVFNADSLFSEGTMPPLVNSGNGSQTVLDMLGGGVPSGETPTNSTPGSAFDFQRGMMGSESSANPGDQLMAGQGRSTSSADVKGEDDIHIDEVNHPLSDSVLIPTLALFYERLGGVMPVFSRTWLFSRLDSDDHLKDQHFAAMLLAMSALTIMQAQPNTEGRDAKTNRMSGRRRRARAVKLLEEALKIRESPFMGRAVTLEQCCTSFFVFATLFGLGEHLAGWYRLRESITIAHLCRLHEPASYENLAKDEAERRLRMYWLLAITERAFAIQSRMPIVLTGNPRASTASLRARLGVRELSDFPDLQLKLFDVVDEKFVDCWNQKCQGATCRNFSRERAIALWRAFTDGINQSSASAPTSKDRSPGGEELEEDAGGSMSSHSPQQTQASFGTPRHKIPATPIQRSLIQKADVEVTRHWLLNRLWLITLNHSLLSLDAKEPPLRIDHAIHVAQSALDVCNDHLSMPSMEAHGVGFTYKLFDIAQTLVLLCNDEAIADAISQRGHLEKQTTAAHTSGRPPSEHKRHSSIETSAGSTQDHRSSNGGYPYPPLGMDGLTLPPMYMTEMAHMGSMRGPASLRLTVLNILKDYFTLFQKFRGGDHPYLEKLADLIDEMKQKTNGSSKFMSPHSGVPTSTRPHSMSQSSQHSASNHDASSVASSYSSARQMGASPAYGQTSTPSGLPSSFSSPYGHAGVPRAGSGPVPPQQRHNSSVSTFVGISGSPRTRAEQT